MVKLPIWVMNQNKPAIYDSESATSIEMVAKVYGAMQELIEEYNNFAESCNNKIAEFESASVQDWDTFKVGLRQEFQDFIDVIDLKVSTFEKDTGEIAKDLENFRKELTSIIAESDAMIESKIDAVIQDKAEPFATKCLGEKRLDYNQTSTKFEIPLTKYAKTVDRKITFINNGDRSFYYKGLILEDGETELKYIYPTPFEFMKPGEANTIVCPTSTTSNPEYVWEHGHVYMVVDEGSTDIPVTLIMQDYIDVEDCYNAIQELKN